MVAQIINRPDSTFGSWCLFCGDYHISRTYFDAMLTASRGCQRCLWDGPFIVPEPDFTETIMLDGVIFDCEIERGMLPKKQQPQLGITYCSGWKDYRGMGVSVIGAYDYTEGTFRVFCKDNLSEFQKLIDSRRWVIGFNSRSFDEPLLQANRIHIPKNKSYDILVEVWRGAGLPLEFAPHTHRGYGLGQLCLSNFNIGKSGDGAQAPTLWQQGKVGTVIDYCLRDVWLTKRLMDRILSEGEIENPKGMGKIAVKRPEERKGAAN